jgi:alpha-tubulin suppressor-like RCC1 family protein
MIRLPFVASHALFLAITLPACTALLDGTFEPAPEDADVPPSDGATDADAPRTDASRDAGVEPVMWTKVAAGQAHACGLRSDGSLWCWGSYGGGQLGDGRVSDGSAAAYPQPTPIRVLAAEGDEAEHWRDWVDVTAGQFHTCGRRDDGSLWCWGSNVYGQLGNGDPGLISTQPVRVVADEDGDDDPWSDWVEVTAGGRQTCGRRDNGTLWCWGWREHGALGDGLDEQERRDTPSLVLGAGQLPGHPGWDDWAGVSSGDSHSCGRLLDGTLWCWGRGNFGQLGDGSDGQDHHRTTPRQVLRAEEEGVGGWDDWVTVAAADSHTCGRRADRTLWCWGSREDGKLGDGLGEAAGRRTTPTQVLGSDGEGWDEWDGVALGMSHTCGTLVDRSLWCWGSGTDGNLGDGFTADRLAPVRVVQADEEPGGAWWDDWVQVTAGRGFTCGLREDGTLWCWGKGEQGQRGDGIGDGTASVRETPVQVLDPPSDG